MHGGHDERRLGAATYIHTHLCAQLPPITHVHAYISLKGFPPPSRARMTRKRRRAAATARRAEAACLMATLSHAVDRSSRRQQ